MLRCEDKVRAAQKEHGPRAGCVECPRGLPECERCEIAEAEDRTITAAFSPDVVADARRALAAARRFNGPMRRPWHWTPRFAALVAVAAYEESVYERSKAYAATKATSAREGT